MCDITGAEIGAICRGPARKCGGKNGGNTYSCSSRSDETQEEEEPSELPPETERYLDWINRLFRE